MAISFLVAIAYAEYGSSGGTSSPGGHFGYNLSVNVNFFPEGNNKYNIVSAHTWYVTNQTGNWININLVGSLYVYKDDGDGQVDPAPGGGDTRLFDNRVQVSKTLAPQGTPGDSAYESRAIQYSTTLDPNEKYYAEGTTHAYRPNTAPTEQANPPAFAREWHP